MSHESDAERRARRWEAVLAERDRLVELVRWRTLSTEDAEDAVQEALLRSVEFEGLDEERVAPFLTTVTMRVCADQHRARQRQHRLDQRVAGRRVEEIGPEEEVCGRAEAAWVVGALAEMPARQRQVVDARLQGLSDAEIASRLGVSYSSVASALARTRTAVRAMLATGCAWLVAIARRPRAVAISAAATAAVGVALTTMQPVTIAPEPSPPSPRSVPVELLVPVVSVPDRPAPAVSRRPEPRRTGKAEPSSRRGRVVGPVDDEYVENDKGTVEQILYCVENPALNLPGSGGKFLCQD